MKSFLRIVTKRPVQVYQIRTVNSNVEMEQIENIRKLSTQALAKSTSSGENKRTIMARPSTLHYLSYDNTETLNRILTEEVRAKLEEYSRLNPASISIQNLLDHGQTATQRESFLFLRKEVPIRMANMIMEMELLPAELKLQAECAQILNDYISSFTHLVEFENIYGNEADLQNYTESLQECRQRHKSTVPMMAVAVNRLAVGSKEGTKEIQYILDRLYTNRISIHVLISHYLALLGLTHAMEGMVGTIEPKCELVDVVEDAFSSAAMLCEAQFHDSPKLEVTAEDISDQKDETKNIVTASVVPDHLQHILFEVFKNSMRATCESAERKKLQQLPSIVCKIYKTQKDVTIKISDLGGGIERSASQKVFNYMYSTAPKVDLEKIVRGDAPMHGLGYGLPLSRLYARYFKGDIQLCSVDGYGTDVYIYLQRLSHMAKETLPVYNVASTARLQSMGRTVQVKDWTDL